MRDFTCVKRDCGRGILFGHLIGCKVRGGNGSIIRKVVLANVTASLAPALASQYLSR